MTTVTGDPITIERFRGCFLSEKINERLFSLSTLEFAIRNQSTARVPQVLCGFQEMVFVKPPQGSCSLGHAKGYPWPTVKHVGLPCATDHCLPFHPGPPKTSFENRSSLIPARESEYWFSEILTILYKKKCSRFY